MPDVKLAAVAIASRFEVTIDSKLGLSFRRHPGEERIRIVPFDPSESYFSIVLFPRLPVELARLRKAACRDLNVNL